MKSLIIIFFLMCYLPDSLTVSVCISDPSQWWRDVSVPFNQLSSCLTSDVLSVVSDVSGGISQMWFQILKQQAKWFLFCLVSAAPNTDWQINAFITSTPPTHLPPLCLEPVVIEQGGCRDQRSGDGGIQSITSNRLSWEDEARDESQTPSGYKSIRGRGMEGGGGDTSISIISVITLNAVFRLSEFHSQHDFTWCQ